MIGTVFPVYFEWNTGPKHDYSLTTPTTVKVFDHLIFIKIKGALSIMYNRNTYIYLCIKEDCTLKSLISRVQKINWPSIHKEIENRSWKNYLSTKLDPRRQFLPPRIGELIPLFRLLPFQVILILQKITWFYFFNTIRNYFFNQCEYLGLYNNISQNSNITVAKGGGGYRAFHNTKYHYFHAKLW